MTAYLAILAIVAVWIISLIVHPFGACWRCGGRGNVIKKGRKGRRKAPKCRVCKGKRRRQRLGARTVHRARRQVAAHWRTPEGGGPR